MTIANRQANHSKVYITETTQFLMNLPKAGAFQKTDLARGSAAELHQIETNTSRLSRLQLQPNLLRTPARNAS